MSNWVDETGIVIPMLCPVCHPEAEPRDYQVTFCAEHYPQTPGECDRLVETIGYISGSAEAEGANNKVFCDFIHRGILRCSTS